MTRPCSPVSRATAVLPPTASLMRDTVSRSPMCLTTCMRHRCSARASSAIVPIAWPVPDRFWGFMVSVRPRTFSRSLPSGRDARSSRSRARATRRGRPSRVNWDVHGREHQPISRLKLWMPLSYSLRLVRWCHWHSGQSKKAGGSSVPASICPIFRRFLTGTYGKSVRSFRWPTSPERTGSSFLLWRPSSLLVWSSLLVALGTLMIPFVPGVGRMFGFVLPGRLELIASLGIVASYVMTAEMAKRLYVRHFICSASRR